MGEALKKKKEKKRQMQEKYFYLNIYLKFQNLGVLNPKTAKL